MTEQVHIYDEPAYERSEKSDIISKALFRVFRDVTMPQKDSYNPHTKKKYASLDAYFNVVLPLLKREGIRLKFSKAFLRSSGQESFCLLLEHAESGQWEINRTILVKGNKFNEYQEDGCARTYQSRYLLREVFGMSGGDDDDAQSIEKSTQTIKKNESYDKWITKENVAHIRSLLIGIGGEDLEKRICDLYKVDGLYKLPQNKYEEVIKIIKS